LIAGRNAKDSYRSTGKDADRKESFLQQAALKHTDPPNDYGIETETVLKTWNINEENGK